MIPRTEIPHKSTRSYDHVSQVTAGVLLADFSLRVPSSGRLDFGSGVHKRPFNTAPMQTPP